MSSQNSAIDALQAEIARMWEPLNRRVEKVAARDDEIEQQVTNYVRTAAQIIVIKLSESFDVLIGDRRLVPSEDKSFVVFRLKQLTSRRYQFSDLHIEIGFGNDFVEIDGLRHPKTHIESVFAKLNSIIVGHFSPDKANGVFVRRAGIVNM